MTQIMRAKRRRVTTSYVLVTGQEEESFLRSGSSKDKKMQLKGRKTGIVHQVSSDNLTGFIRVKDPSQDRSYIEVSFDVHSFLENFFKLKVGEKISLFVNDTPRGYHAGGIVLV